MRGGRCRFPFRLATSPRQPVPRDDLTAFIKDYYANAASRPKTNRDLAKEAAEAFFGRIILEPLWRAAFAKAGIDNKGGRPRNP